MKTKYKQINQTLIMPSPTNNSKIIARLDELDIPYEQGMEGSYDCIFVYNRIETDKVIYTIKSDEEPGLFVVHLHELPTH